MANQSFIYNGSGTANAPRKITVSKNNYAILRSAALFEDVFIYMQVGSDGCDSSFTYVPLIICGLPVTLGPETPVLALDAIGTYYLGDPNGPPLSFTPVTQITVEYAREVPESLIIGCYNRQDPVLRKTIVSGAGYYASGTAVADWIVNGNGNTYSPPTIGLQSITIIVHVADDLPTGTNYVEFTTLDEVHRLIKGAIRTWSVAQDVETNEQLSRIVNVRAIGNAAFEIIWTKEAL